MAIQAMFTEPKENLGERAAGGTIAIYANSSKQTLIQLYGDSGHHGEISNPVPIDNNGIVGHPIFAHFGANSWYVIKDARGALVREGNTFPALLSMLGGRSIFAWNSASSVTDISQIEGMSVGDYIINTGSSTRAILGVTAPIGEVVQAITDADGQSRGNIRGAQGLPAAINYPIDVNRGGTGRQSFSTEKKILIGNGTNQIQEIDLPSSGGKVLARNQSNTGYEWIAPSSAPEPPSPESSELASSGVITAGGNYVLASDDIRLVHLRATGSVFPFFDTFLYGNLDALTRRRAGTPFVLHLDNQANNIPQNQLTEYQVGMKYASPSAILDGIASIERWKWAAPDPYNPNPVYSQNYTPVNYIHTYVYLGWRHFYVEDAPSGAHPLFHRMC